MKKTGKGGATAVWIKLDDGPTIDRLLRFLIAERIFPATPFGLSGPREFLLSYHSEDAARIIEFLRKVGGPYSLTLGDSHVYQNARDLRRGREVQHHSPGTAGGQSLLSV